ncbi:serine protease [Actinomadura craniellae]|uniref:Serine protease n=1 Tax=Actinomadura craniellae TaxID=2231787 RepID=A0A365H341_9ACTN|nr:serine protease [Actinomadura craniellae]
MTFRPGVALALACAVATAAGPPARADGIRDRFWPVLAALDVPRAWNLTRGNGATVAVLDSGVDPAQADLAGSVTVGPDRTAGANPRGVPPRQVHGTTMASIIAGHGHGPRGLDGMTGVAPEARVLSLRVILEDDEPGFDRFNSAARYRDVIADGIRYAADHGADVISMSFGRTTPSDRERRAIAYAIDRGAVVVAAAGNEGDGKPARRPPYSYPASFPGVVSVAATDREGRHAGFSSRNSAVVVSAPGVDIVGAGPGRDYWVGDGTSPATALVAGVAALVRARHPGLAPPLVVQALVTGTAHRPAGGYDPGVGFGTVNAAAALAAADRLAGTRAAGLGLPESRRFGPGPDSGRPGPAEIALPDTGRLAVPGLAAALSSTGLLVSLTFLAARRPRRAAGDNPSDS